MKTERFILMASAMLALAFIFSCTSTDEPAGNSAFCQIGNNCTAATAEQCLAFGGQVVLSCQAETVGVNCQTANGCIPNVTVEQCLTLLSGQVVASCDGGQLPSSSSDGEKSSSSNGANAATEFCDWGPFTYKASNGELGGGCWPIDDQAALNACKSDNGNIVTVCPNHACPAGMTKNGWGGCEGTPPTTCNGYEAPNGYCRTITDAGITNGTATHCDWGEPRIGGSGEMMGDCWSLEETVRTDCLNYGKGVTTCPTYQCPAGTARPNPGAACEIGGVTPPNPTSYCYWKANDCWPIGVASLPSEEYCENEYGKIVSSCSGVVIDYCDWGPFVINGNKVDGGCWPNMKRAEITNCTANNRVVSVCPTYQCPAGTTRNEDHGGCDIGSVTPPNPTTKYCYWNANECWPIGVADLPSEEYCENEYGMVVSSCSNVVLDYCDWGPFYIEGSRVDGGCWWIKNQTERSGCTPASRVVSVCPSYSCPVGTTSTDYGGCEISN